MQCGIRLPSVRARIPAECGIRSQRVWLPVRCSAVTSAGYERALGGSQTCNIWLPPMPYGGMLMPYDDISIPYHDDRKSTNA